MGNCSTHTYSLSFSENNNRIPLLLNTVKNFLIIYCITGKLTIKTKDGIYDLEAGEFFVVLPSSTIKKIDMGKSLIYDFNYNGKTEGINPGKYQDPDFTLFHIFKMLYSAQFSDFKYKNDYINACHNLIIFRIIDKSINDSLKSADADIINRFINYIGNNYHKKINFEELSASFGYSYSNTRRMFKKQTGQTLKSFLTDIRLNKSKELLINSDLSINYISESVGFSSTKYFTHIFQSAFGLTPKMYRLKEKNKNNE